jgi:hypothetical protein
MVLSSVGRKPKTACGLGTFFCACAVAERKPARQMGKTSARSKDENNVEPKKRRGIRGKPQILFVK